MLRRLVPLCLAGLLVTACGDDGDGPLAVTTDATGAVADTAPEAEAGAPASVPAPTDDTSAATTPAASAPAEEQTGATTPGAVPAALQFSAPLVGGGEIELGEYAGRPVLLWFWAPW